MTILSRLKHWLRPSADVIVVTGREPFYDDPEIEFLRQKAAGAIGKARKAVDCAGVTVNQRVAALRDAERFRRLPKDGRPTLPAGFRAPLEMPFVKPPATREEAASLRAAHAAARAADPGYQPPKPWPKPSRPVPMPMPGIDLVQPPRAELYGAPWAVSTAVAEAEARASIERDDIWPVAAAVGLAVAIAATADDSGGGGDSGGAGASGEF